ncbi:prepilin-type N-terminal cleavage/methylation domain-containing protein [Pasteurellaceae bacterium HPA106]|uniref:pilin n=1 Tax=Spirabiliibacterium pneumoniae TaxID=221400 RepID=UPI001AAD9ACD|nr:prepilin-type N-terminal cleavage/methylation domain-containing protein [Spirabiliibacterium pneumoniae]MBE2896771.1 prepilin-type N-terminal cleavage/methylation domain-containing protein [Spirabiliibacterium pneumoniae]
MQTLVKNRVKPGFTLIELMIVIAIIAVLATIAVPAYQNYTKKAALSEMLQAASPYRSDVELCLYNLEASQCNAQSNGVGQNKDYSSDNSVKYTKSITTSAGVITVEGKAVLNGYSYTMTPSKSDSGEISWSVRCAGEDTSLFPAGFCNAG